MTDRDSTTTKLREVPIAWEALEDAFENNAPEVNSYLQLHTGEVLRIVDGLADPGMHERVLADPNYLHIDPVSSREQYRWMERFIESLADHPISRDLARSIDGKGAFRRFKDVLMGQAVEREQWFTFRSERLRACMVAWLEAHGIVAVERPQWRVPTAEEVKPHIDPQVIERPGRRSRAAVVELQRARLHELVDLLPARELDAALAFLDFLRERKHLPRPVAKVSGTGEPAADVGGGAAGAGEAAELTEAGADPGDPGA